MSLIPIEPGCYYLMSKGYVDFKQLFNHLHRQRAFFVTKTKDYMKYEIVEEHSIDKGTSTISDSFIRLAGIKTYKWHPKCITSIKKLYILSSAIGNVLFERGPLGESFVKPKRLLNDTRLWAAHLMVKNRKQQ